MGSARMLFNSFKPSARIWSSFLSTSGLLFPQNERRRGKKGDGKARQRQMVDPELGEPEPLGEGADADLLEPGRRKAEANGAPGARQRGDRNEQSGEADGWNERNAGRSEHRGHLRANDGRHQESKPGRRAHTKESAGDERRPGALDRHAEHENRQQDKRGETQDADQDVRKLLADQE